MFLIPALGLLLLMRSSATEKLTPPEDLPDAQTLTVVNTGIFALTPDTMGITFYIHLVNNLPVNLDVATRMWECCETFDEGEVDCSHIHLLGGYKGIIRAGHASNVTLFYPNLYVYNRIGECLVGIWFRDPDGKVKELRTKISFDTTLTPRQIAPSITTYYDSETTRVRKCTYIDEDPLDKCRPVDCSRKYNGQMLFYSNVDRRCLAAPKCNETKSKNQKINLPHLVYAPEGNTCDNLDPIINEDDIRTLNSGRGVDQDLHPSNEYDFIVCHNGNKSIFTGRCTCNEGWSSTTNHIRPTALKVHLCTVSQFGPTSSFEDTMEEVIYTIRDVTPCFRESLICFLQCSWLPAALLGTMALLSIFLSSIYNCLYQKECSDTSLDINTKKTKEHNENREKLERMEEDKCDSKHALSDISINSIYLSNRHNSSTLGYHDFSVSSNISSLCQKHRYLKEHNVIEHQPSTSIDFYTETLPHYQKEDYNATRSMSPEEKLLYLGRSKQKTPNELEPLLLEERLQNNSIVLRNDRSTCATTFKIPTKPSEDSHVTNLWRNNLNLQKMFEARKRKDVSRDKRAKRMVEASTFSKSMAQLTYSTLPTSDSLLSLDETGTTYIPTEDEL